MISYTRRILWVDDEIDMLTGHIIFLEKKGYELTPVTNGQDALALIREDTFDAVLLDEMMPGMDGLKVLEEIKAIDPGLPVVMITKSEEEHIMDDALGSRISDYLIKPVHPGQIHTTLKRLLDTDQLRSERVSREYARQTSQNRLALASGLDWRGWVQMHLNLARWDAEIVSFNDPGLRHIHEDQKHEFRREFGHYIERIYPRWIAGEDAPMLSHTLLDTVLAPELARGGKVYFIVIDCFRYDHWLAIEPTLERFFHIQRSSYFSILPTATPFSRNALFAGLLPREIDTIYPDIYQHAGHDEISMNRYEQDLLNRYFTRRGITFDKPPAFEKIVTAESAQDLLKRLRAYRDNRLVTIIYNFIDILSHQRAEQNILREIAPDEAAFRSLTTTWFDHSALLDIIKNAAEEGATVIITTDHGSLTCEKASLVRGDRTTSSNVRYKYGKNVKCSPSEVILVEDPHRWGLPSFGHGTTFLFAKEEYYLIYQNNYRQFERLYQNSLQHGGVSMEEMILPVGVLTPR